MWCYEEYSTTLLKVCFRSQDEEPKWIWTFLSEHLHPKRKLCTKWHSYPFVCVLDFFISESVSRWYLGFIYRLQMWESNINLNLWDRPLLLKLSHLLHYHRGLQQVHTAFWCFIFFSLFFWSRSENTEEEN